MFFFFKLLRKIIRLPSVEINIFRIIRLLLRKAKQRNETWAKIYDYLDISYIFAYYVNLHY